MFFSNKLMHVLIHVQKQRRFLEQPVVWPIWLCSRVCARIGTFRFLNTIAPKTNAEFPIVGRGQHHGGGRGGTGSGMDRKDKYVL